VVKGRGEWRDRSSKTRTYHAVWDVIGEGTMAFHVLNGLSQIEPMKKHGSCGDHRLGTSTNKGIKDVSLPANKNHMGQTAIAACQAL